MKNNNIYTVVWFFVLVFLLPVQNLYAETSPILLVSPKRITIPLNANSQSLNITNQSKKPRRYSVDILNQVMTENGTIKNEKNFKYSAKKMIRFTPKRFTLQPGEEKTINVVIKRPKGLADGDYHSHLLFREVNLRQKDKEKLTTKNTAKKTSFKVTALYGVAVPIVIQQGDIHSNIYIEKISLEPKKKKSIQIILKRTGNAEAVATLDIIYARKGKKNIQLAPKEQVRLYREINTVIKSVNFSLLRNEKLQDGKIVVTLKSKNTLKQEKKLMLP